MFSSDCTNMRSPYNVELGASYAGTQPASHLLCPPQESYETFVRKGMALPGNSQFTQQSPHLTTNKRGRSPSPDHDLYTKLSRSTSGYTPPQPKRARRDGKGLNADDLVQVDLHIARLEAEKRRNKNTHNQHGRVNSHGPHNGGPSVSRGRRSQRAVGSKPKKQPNPAVETHDCHSPNYYPESPTPLVDDSSESKKRPNHATQTQHFHKPIYDLQSPTPLVEDSFEPKSGPNRSQQTQHFHKPTHCLQLPTPLVEDSIKPQAFDQQMPTVFEDSGFSSSPKDVAPRDEVVLRSIEVDHNVVGPFNSSRSHSNLLRQVPSYDNHNSPTRQKRTEFKHYASKISKIAGRMNEMHSKIKDESKSKDQQIVELKRALEKSENEVAKLHKTHADLEDELESKDQHIVELERALKRSQAKESKDQHIIELERALKGSEDKVTELEADVEAMQHLWCQSNGEVETLTAEGNQFQTALQQRDAQLQSAKAEKDIADDAAGFWRHHATEAMRDAEQQKREAAYHKEEVENMLPTYRCWLWASNVQPGAPGGGSQPLFSYDSASSYESVDRAETASCTTKGRAKKARETAPVHDAGSDLPDYNSDEELMPSAEEVDDGADLYDEDSEEGFYHFEKEASDGVILADDESEEELTPSTAEGEVNVLEDEFGQDFIALDPNSEEEEEL